MNLFILSFLFQRSYATKKNLLLKTKQFKTRIISKNIRQIISTLRYNGKSLVFKTNRKQIFKSFTFVEKDFELKSVLPFYIINMLVCIAKFKRKLIQEKGAQSADKNVVH